MMQPVRAEKQKMRSKFIRVRHQRVLRLAAEDMRLHRQTRACENARGVLHHLSHGILRFGAIQANPVIAEGG